MRTTVARFLALAVAATATLALAANALATPRLIVSGGAAAGVAAATTIQVTEDKTDAAPLKISIYEPAGYAATLNQVAGTQIGTVHADLQALAISPDAIIQADGTVVVDDPAKHTADACAPGAHAAVWLLHVTVSGTTLDVAVYVDPTTGVEQALGAAKLVLCLPDPYIPQSAGGAAFGVKIINAKLLMNSGVVTNPSSPGTYLWRSIITPWNPLTPAPNAAGTIEAQSIVNLPGKATLRATVKKVTKKKSRVTLGGSVTENGAPVSGAIVLIYANGKKVATAKTNSSGLYVKALLITKVTKFQAKATAPQRDTACVSPLPATSVPGGCVGATVGPYQVASSTIATKLKK